MIITQGKDSTLDPAYFAVPPKNGTSSDSNLDNRVTTLEQQQAEATKKINELVTEYNNLELDNKQQQETLDEIAVQLNQLFEKEETQDEKIDNLTQRLDEATFDNMTPIPDDFINELNFTSTEETYSG